MVKGRIKLAVIDAFPKCSHKQANTSRELLVGLLAYDDGCALGHRGPAAGSARALPERKDTHAVPELTQALTFIWNCWLSEQELSFCVLTSYQNPLISAGLPGLDKIWLRIVNDYLLTLTYAVSTQVLSDPAMALATVQQAVGALMKGDLQALVDCFSEDAVLTVTKDQVLLGWQQFCCKARLLLSMTV